MFGKLLGAFLGEKIAGSNSGAKGAILGFGAAAIARRSIPALAVVGLVGWGARKLLKRRNAAPAYPPEATPTPL